MAAMNKDVWLSETRLVVLSIAVIAVVCLSFALSYTGGILVPFIFSLFLYLLLLPLMRMFRTKLKLPRGIALALTFMVVFVLVIFLGLFLTTTIQAFIDSYEAYQEKVIMALERFRGALAQRGLQVEHLNIEKYLKELPFVNIVGNAGFGVINFLTKVTLVFVFLLFLFTGTQAGGFVEDRVKNKLMIEIDHRVRQYLLTKLATSSLTAAIVGLFFYFVGLDFAFTFTVLVFVLNFIPTIGSIIATLIPIPVALIQYDLGIATAVILVPGVFQFVIGSIIEPRLLGGHLKLHPVVILISLMFWSLIWGVPGAFLAVPITAIVKIVFEKIEGGQALADLMAGKISSS